MSFLRVLIYFLLLFLALLVGVLSYLHFADLNQYKGRIAAHVQETTGRDFALGSLAVDLWPSVRIAVDGVTLANTPWGSDPQMLQLGRLEATVKPLSLLFGPILLTDFTLEDVALLLESDSAGDNNWSMAPGSQSVEEGSEVGGESGGSKRRVPVRLENLRITNVVITRRQPDSEDQEFRLDRVRLQPDAANVRRLVGTGKILGQPLALNGQFGHPGEQGKGSGQPFQIDGLLGSLELSASGVQGARGAPHDTRVETELRTDDLAAFLTSMGVTAPLSGPLSIKAVVTPGAQGRTAIIDAELDTLAARLMLEQEDDQVSLEGTLEGLAGFGEKFGVVGLSAQPVAIEGRLERGADTLDLQELKIVSGQAQISATGTLASGRQGSVLQLKVAGESLSDLLSTLPALAFDGTAQVKASAGDVVIDPLALRFGASDIGGNVRFGSGDSSVTTIDLTSRKLDLSQFFAVNDGTPEDDQGAAQSPAQADQEYVFGEEPLPFKALQQNEMNMTIVVEQLVGPASTLENVDFTASLQGGELKGAVDFATPVGARSTSRFSLKTSGEQGELKAMVRARDMRLNIASGEDALPEEIPPVSVSLSIVASGGSPRELASNSNGDLLVTLGEGRLVNKLIGRFSGDIVSQLSTALNPFAEKEPDTTFECGVIAVAIVDGLSALDALILQGEKVTIVGEGEIDLKTEELRVTFNTQPREGIGFSADMFVTPFVALDGTLAQPRVGANTRGTAIAVATGGLSLLWRSASDRAAGNTDHCIETMPEYQHPPLAEQ